MTQDSGLLRFERQLEDLAHSAVPRIRRFGTGFGAALLSGVLAAPAHWTETAIASLGIGAVITGLGETSPMVPWKALYAALERAKWGPPQPTTSTKQADRGDHW